MNGKFEQVGNDKWLAIFSLEPLMIDGSIEQFGERDFRWGTRYINGRDIDGGTAVSLKQAQFLATKAYEDEARRKLAPALPGVAPRSTL